MYLVDTSAWLEFGRKQPRTVGQRLRALIESDVAVFVTGIVVQEVLQGARDASHFEQMRSWLGAQRRISVKHELGTHVAASRLYAECRWRGFTPRSSVDCLVASIAIEHHLILLHDDRDYEKIAEVEPRLKLA